MTRDQIRKQIATFIKENYIFDDRKELQPQESLIGSGVIDSTGVLELIGFLEQTYNIRFEDRELVAENFDSLEKISNFVAGKLSL